MYREIVLILYYLIEMISQATVAIVMGGSTRVGVVYYGCKLLIYDIANET